ncbi:hypothetical protein OPT61_g3805 [Boeremia exigua]|uniref:Uncharacterized protein n=1 Tax=Boeremia exigua TaxID=749465 RepID=A0ACC2IGK2_9PLEO|nr:hypothetical protein OPT61_g3805 [Boeremia exigua]
MEQHHLQHAETIHRGRSNVLIPNPRYVSDAETPRYAAFRLMNGLIQAAQDDILRAVHQLKESGLKSQTTAAHGSNFHQEWFGVWRRYSPTSVITSAETQANPKQAASIQNFMRVLDGNLGGISAKLRATDEPAWFRAQYQHRGVADLIRRGAEAQPTKPTTKLLEQCSSRRNNSAFRLGGIGTMLAVSSGEGTAYHYDTHDDAHQYSIVIALGRGGVLHLP